MDNVIEFREIGGALVPFENNRALCSSRAEEEARQWVNSQGLNSRLAVILGLGAGHHVRTWLEANPDGHAVIIDPRPGLIKTFLTANKDLRERIEIHVIDSVDALLGHEVMNIVAQDVPPILLFQPAVGAWDHFFGQAFATLTGRNVAGLKFFLQTYGYEADVTSESTDDRLLTIKDLGLVIDTSLKGHPAATAVRVLKELVI